MKTFRNNKSIACQNSNTNQENSEQANNPDIICNIILEIRMFLILRVNHGRYKFTITRQDHPYHPNSNPYSLL